MTTTARTKENSIRTAMGRVVSLVYGIGCYAAFVLVFSYAIAFLADVVVPRTVDEGGPEAGTVTAVLIDVTLLAVFAVQHSVMARPAFKRQWTRLLPPHIERSTYVLTASAALALALWQWHPINAQVWDVPAPAGRVLLWGLFAAGWVWVLAMSFAIDHIDLFGLRQVSRHLRGDAENPPTFALPLPYRLVRHPMMLGFFPAFLAAPTMTLGHSLFAALGCSYILFGVRLEERDLTLYLPEYDAYAARTPRFLPRWRHSP